jgi:hypothetical protein
MRGVMKQLFEKMPSNGAFRRIGILSTLWIFTSQIEGHPSQENRWPKKIKRKGRK